MLPTAYHKKIILTILFAVSMAYLESAVVVYLRTIYYPEGFYFPLKEFPIGILITEIGREVATIIMIWSISMLSGTNRREIFAYFALNFGIWDICYYIWLKVLLGWPSNILDWDILFLIPLPWVGPVLAPVLVSIALIFAGLMILKFEASDNPIRLSRSDWFLEIIAGLVIIFSFLGQIETLAQNGIPKDYSWVLFLFGLFSGLAIFIKRILESSKFNA